MANSDASRSFADSPIARVLALLLALLIGLLLYMNWADEFRNLFAGKALSIPIASKSEPVKAVNPTLEACLEQLCPYDFLLRFWHPVNLLYLRYRLLHLVVILF